MSFKKLIDPIKEINNTKYLNSVAIKSRYELMKVNKENLKNGYEIGTHWVKYTPYPVIDDDIRDNMAKLESFPIKKIATIKKGILDDISNSDIINQINMNDQTKKLSKEIKSFQKKNCEMHELEKKWVYIPKSIRLFKQYHPTDMFYTHKSNNFSKFYKTNNNIKNLETTTIPINRKPFSFTDKNFKLKYDKKVYDIKPLHIKNEKGRCYFPKIRNSSLDSIQDKANNDNSNQRKTSDRTGKNIILFSILSPEEIKENKTIYEKEIAKTNKSKNLFIGKDGDKKRVNLSVLAKDLKNNRELYKNIHRNENFNKKNIFRRSIQITNLPAFNEKEEEKKIKNLKKNRKYFDGKFLDDEIILNNEFPQRFYGLNYRFNENKRDIKTTNDNIDLYQNEMNKKFVDIKEFVDKNFEKYLSPDINKEYDKKLIELKKNYEEKKKK